MATIPRTVRFGTAQAAPGRKAWGHLHAREGKRRVSLAVGVINGRIPGEHVVLLANQHGVELNGVEVLRRLFEETNPREVRGTVFLVPSCNPVAALRNEQTWVEDPRKIKRSGEEAGYRNEYNMNFNWPGCRGASLVKRVCHEIWSQAVLAPHRRASLVVDIHCHQKDTAVYAHLHPAADLGVVAGIRNNIVTGETFKIVPNSSACTREGIMGLCIELCGQGEFNPASIRDGLRAMRNLLKFWGVMSGRLDLPEEAVVLDPWRSTRPQEKCRAASYATCKAPCAGLVVPRKGWYEMVKKGEVLCDILDPHTGRIAARCRSPRDGGIYMILSSRPAVKKGDAVFTVSLARMVKPAAHVAGLDPAKFRAPAWIKAASDFMLSHPPLTPKKK
jgi:predicted deacylase